MLHEMHQEAITAKVSKAFVIVEGDCLSVLRGMPDESVNCCVTSPPYWGLRDYGVSGQLGLESTPEEYIAKLVVIFREVRRVLRDEGTLWLNLGDSDNAYNGNRGKSTSFQSSTENALPDIPAGFGLTCKGLKNKDLVGIPWSVAFALRTDGWYLRSDIIWHKPNPMPESITDRPTKAHEYLFLLSKNERYYYDALSIAEPLTRPEEAFRKTPAKFGGASKFVEAQKQSRLHSGNEYKGTPTGTRNRRTVWTVATKPFKGAHFATFPPKLIEPCILAGCPVGGVVLDPFAGSGTTGLVATEHNRRFVGIELNPAYCNMTVERILRAAGVSPEGAV